MDPIQEVIEIETGDGQAAVAALSEIVAGLREELERTRAELAEMAEGLEDTDAGAGGAGSSLKGMSRGGVSGLGSAVRTVNPELGSMVMLFGSLQLALPKLAASLKALPAAMGPVGWAALAIAAAFSAITYATNQLGKELDELDRQLEEHGKQLNTAAAIGDEVDAINKRITDDLKLMTGEVTEADLAIADFNDKIDRMTERQIRLLGVEGDVADGIRANRQALKDRNEELERSKEAVKAATAATRDQALADKTAAAAAKLHAQEAARVTDEMLRASALAVAAATTPEMGGGNSGELRRALDVAEAMSAATIGAISGIDPGEMNRAINHALRGVKLTKLREAFAEAAEGAAGPINKIGALLGTGGDPLALLGMIPGVGGGIAAGLGGLASLGGKSDEELDAMFGGLADAIIAGLERLPDILGPLVVDFALALVLNLPRALAEAFAGLVSELFALIFPNRADKREGLTDAQRDEALAIAAELQAQRDAVGAPENWSARTGAPTPTLGGTNATPALAAALAGGRRRGGRVSIQLRQPSIFGTTQEIERSTGPGGLRERS